MIVALVNGFAVGAARAVNGRLTMSKGALSASFWNHLIGFLFLSSVVLISASNVEFSNVPTYTFLGGLIGAFYVVVNSYVIPKLGATMSTLLVISGQLTISAIFDAYRDIIVIDMSISTLKLLVGFTLIALGVLFSFRTRV